MLDNYYEEITGKGDKLAKKKKKKIAARIKRKMKRNHTFHCLSRHAGKGIRDNIKRLQALNRNSNTDETSIKREEIEGKIKYLD